MLHATTCPSHTDTTPLTLSQLRQLRDENHTCLVDNLIVDKRTGEVIGCYMHSQFAPEPYSYPVQVKKKAAHRPRFTVLDNGTPVEINEAPEAAPQHSADIIEFPAKATSTTSNAGRRPLVLTNPIAGFLHYFEFDGYSAAWVDDIVSGACGTQVENEGGREATTGRFNVSPSDVRRVLKQPHIGAKTAATILCNHNKEPMDIRQVERVVQAARIALGGLMRHIERHPGLMEQFECTLDFDSFWSERGTYLRGESPDKAEAIRLFQQDPAVTVGAVAKMFGVHRNTASNWKQAALMHN
ncbi:helix-turn-helix domain-containing protein [Pseudomonas monteilii]|uniref:helix-turn-helix domain-containing protein n=1 Tax=Pseudomonas monteilii TaxID=76759 RepID=UPI000A4E50A7|nr:helix-turn-helix domain-containing protein [Pseudomonas monteilii]